MRKSILRARPNAGLGLQAPVPNKIKLPTPGPNVESLDSVPTRRTVPAGDLKSVLQVELRQGENLRQRLHHQGIARVGGPMITAPVTEAEVVSWEDRVADLLQSEPLMLARFLSDPIETYEAALTSGFSVLYGRLNRRLVHRLTMLGQLIRGLSR